MNVFIVNVYGLAQILKSLPQRLDLSDLVITGHLGLGTDPPKRVGPGKGSYSLVVSEPRFRRFYKMILKLFVNDFEIFFMTCIAFAYKG